nr:MAG TPA: hypothetical protein [Bacteriophage sp.]
MRIQESNLLLHGNEPCVIIPFHSSAIFSEISHSTTE